jgi:hypothetical protein
VSWPRPATAGLLAVAALAASCGTSRPSASHETITEPPPATSPVSSAATTAPSTSTSAPSSTTVPASPGTSLVLNTQPPLPSTAPPAVSAGVDMQSSTAIAQVALKALWTVNAAADRSPFAAEVRATAYMTPAYAAEIRGAPPVAAPGAQWQSWVDHHVVTTVVLLAEHDSGAPLSTPNTAYLQYGVTITPHGTDGWTAPPNTLTEFVVLSRRGPRSPWRVSLINTSG